MNDGNLSRMVSNEMIVGKLYTCNNQISVIDNYSRTIDIIRKNEYFVCIKVEWPHSIKVLTSKGTIGWIYIRFPTETKEVQGKT